MTIGTALGNAIAGYRDSDNKRCATGLADVVAEANGLREDRDALLRAVSLAIHELNYHHPERALEVLKSARAAALSKVRRGFSEKWQAEHGTEYPGGIRSYPCPPDDVASTWDDEARAAALEAYPVSRPSRRVAK